MNRALPSFAPTADAPSALRVAAAALALSTLLAVPRAHAAESYDACVGYIDALPATISTQGVWCLREDLATSIASGNAILVTTNNVTIDCNGFKLGGLGAGAGTLTSGIRSADRANTIVRRCNIRGFFYGVNFDGATRGAIVEDNLFEANTYAAIWVSGDDAMLRGNRVTDTGGSALGLAFGIAASGRADIVDNTVADVVAEQDAYGIWVSGSSMVVGNRVRAIVGGEDDYAIWVNSATTMTIRENTLHGPATEAIHCASDDNTSARNVMSGFGALVSACYSSGNIANPN